MKHDCTLPTDLGPIVARATAPYRRLVAPSFMRHMQAVLYSVLTFGMPLPPPTRLRPTRRRRRATRLP